MAEHVYLLTLILPLVTILIVFAMKYAAAAVQARANKKNQEAYHALAAAAANAQQENAEALAAIRADLARLSTSIGSVETILKQVE